MVVRTQRPKVRRRTKIELTVEQFLEAMFVEMEPEYYGTVVTAFTEDPHDAPRRVWAGEPWARGCKLSNSWIGKWSEGRNAYLTISCFTVDPETQTLRRTKANFYAMHAVMIDDIGPKVDRKQLKLPLSAEVETSPGNCQGWLFIKQDADSRNREICENLIDAMIKGGLTADATDPGMRGVTRYGRLPDSINNKNNYVRKLGKPWDVRVRGWNPERRYTIGQIAKAYALDLQRARIKARSQVKMTPLTKSQRTRMDKRFRALVGVLEDFRMYKRRQGSGPWHEIRCPWVHEHTDEADSGAAICEPTADNQWRGAFRCHHGHCEGRGLRHLHAFVLDEARRRCERELGMGEEEDVNNEEDDENEEQDDE